MRSEGRLGRFEIGAASELPNHRRRQQRRGVRRVRKAEVSRPYLICRIVQLAGAVSNSTTTPLSPRLPRPQLVGGHGGPAVEIPAGGAGLASTRLSS
eukprot:scaffold942_cov260-Pinguiococcus_pyrenoidosus.AAC.7